MLTYRAGLSGASVTARPLWSSSKAVAMTAADFGLSPALPAVLKRHFQLGTAYT